MMKYYLCLVCSYCEVPGVRIVYKMKKYLSPVQVDVIYKSSLPCWKNHISIHIELH